LDINYSWLYFTSLSDTIISFGTREWMDCGLVITERAGKAIKKPAKNTLVSFAVSEMGTGKGFAYQEFLDQLGAFLGPVMLFIISYISFVFCNIRDSGIDYD